MKISKLDIKGDWTLDVISDDGAILQNMVTRVKSFANDWFLDYGSHIDYMNLIGQKATQEAIRREVQRVIIGSEGVEELNSLIIQITEDRVLVIEVEITINNYQVISEQLKIDL